MDVVPFEAAVAYTRITLLLGTSLVTRFAHSNLHEFDFFFLFSFFGGEGSLIGMDVLVLTICMYNVFRIAAL